MVQDGSALDQFVDEVDGAGVSFEWRGDRYDLPPRLSALVVVRAERWHRRGVRPSDEVAAEEVFALLRALFGGDDPFEAFLERSGVAVDDLGEVLTAALGAYSGNARARQAQAAPGGETSI